MRNVNGKNLLAMVERCVDEDKSILITDENKDYNRVDRIIER